MSSLGARTWPELDARAATLVAVPVGSCEQHGPHLPLSTDTLVADELCASLARRRGDVVVAPSVGIGASGEHASFPGTLSVGTEVLSDYLVELVRSSRAWSAGVVVVSGHAGNADALDRVARVAEHEGDTVCTFLPRVDGADAHAGRTETSMLLALAPHLVRHNELMVGATEPLSTLIGAIRDRGVREVAPNGVLGDPRGASAEHGAALLASLADALAASVEATFGAPR